MMRPIQNYRGLTPEMQQVLRDGGATPFFRKQKGWGPLMPGLTKVQATHWACALQVA